MHLVCLHEKKLRPLVEVGASIEDLTPEGLWDTEYHIISMSEAQFKALGQLYSGPPGELGYEELTPSFIREHAPAEQGYLYCRGGRIPNGTKLRATYLSRRYDAEIRGGKVWLNQRSFDSPSKAARSITKNSVNGWKWWEYYDTEAKEWRELSVLRNPGGQTASEL